MADDRFSIGDAVRFGWEAMKNNFLFFLLFLIVAWAVTGGISALGSIDREAGLTFFPFFSGVLGWIVGIFISIAQAKIGLRLSAAPEAKAEVSDAWTGWPYFLKYVWGSSLSGFLYGGGFNNG